MIIALFIIDFLCKINYSNYYHCVSGLENITVEYNR